MNREQRITQLEQRVDELAAANREFTEHSAAHAALMRQTIESLSLLAQIALRQERDNDELRTRCGIEVDPARTASRHSSLQAFIEATRLCNLQMEKTT